MTAAWVGIVMICWTRPDGIERFCLTASTAERFVDKGACDAFLDRFVAGLSPIDIVVMRECFRGRNA